MTIDREAAVAEVEGWGFKKAFTYKDTPNAYYTPHAHEGLTTHLILTGSLTISYPDDPSPTKETVGPGTRLDVAPGRRHEVWVGAEGCEMVIGE